jgi:hypothetical protein
MERELDNRLRVLVSSITRPTRRNSDLEQITQISAMTWASWWAGRAKPSSIMLATLCTAFPEDALWLMTGKGGALREPDALEDEGAIKAVPGFAPREAVEALQRERAESIK